MSGVEYFQQPSGHLQLAGQVIITESEHNDRYHESNELVDLLDAC
jgi:hypothetical protein